MIYNQQGVNLEEAQEKPFVLERDIQNLFEANLKALMSLQLVKSEFTIKNKRIDTLAFDQETKAFIIIEYKKDKNHSVVDQGVSYLNLMLEYKADFIIEYNESLNQNLKRENVDWSQVKVCFVSQSFTENQKQSTNFKDLSIELWEVRRFTNDVLIVNPIKKSTSAPTIKTIANQNQLLQKVAIEIKEYSEQDHLNGKSPYVKELYESFKNGILNLPGDISLVPKKTYIAFKTKTNVVDIELQMNSFKMWINLKKNLLDDPKHLMRDVSMLKGHNGNGDYELIVKDTLHLEYILSLIKQAI